MTIAVPPCTFVGLCTRAFIVVVVLVFRAELAAQMSGQRITFKQQQIHMLNYIKQEGLADANDSARQR